MLKKSNIALTLAILVVIITTTIAWAAPPPLPSSFYGTVKLNGANVPSGTLVSAWIGGVKFAEAPTRVVGSDSVYVIDVPGDILDSAPIEGGAEGKTILFRVDGFNTEQTATWSSGTLTELNLTNSPAPVARFSPAKGLNVAQLEDGASIADFSSTGPADSVKPEKAIDASTTSIWRTATGQVTDQWIKVKLTGDGAHVVNRVVLKGSSFNAGLKDFEVRVSTTGTNDANFTTVFTGTLPQDNDLHEFTFAPVQARYVQLFILNNWGSASTVDVAHFQVWTRERQGGIVSLGAGPSASVADFSSELSASTSPEQMLDEHSSTAWRSANGQTSDQWVKVQLGGGLIYTIDRVRLQASSTTEAVQDFEIRVSTTTADDAAFTTVLSGTGANTTNLQEFDFPTPVQARYVQLFVKNNHGSTCCVRVNTFQVLTPDGANVARLEGVGAFVIEASSQFSTNMGPDKAIDFDTDSIWQTASGQVTNQWLKLRLIEGGPHLIDRIKLQGRKETTAPNAFQIRVSNTTPDDASFKTIFSGTLPQDGLPHWVTFPAAEARYVQLFILNNHGSTSSIRLNDFQVYSPHLGGATVPLDDLSIDSDGQVVGWNWNFGDGSTSTEQHPLHTFAAPGTHNIGLTVTDNDGNTDSATLDYTVLEAPTADFTWSPDIPDEGQFTSFTDLSRDTDGSIIGWRWQFAHTTDKETQDTSTVFPDSGAIPVGLTVTDSQLLATTRVQTVTVSNVPPTVDIGPDQTVPWGQSLTLDATVGDAGTTDRLSLVCDWEFGDGQTSQITNCNSFIADVSHVYTETGVYTASLTVTDKDGASTTDSQLVTVIKRDSNVAIVSVRHLAAAETEVVAKLYDATGPNIPLAGKPISIVWESQVVEGTTNADGTVTALFPFALGQEVTLTTAFAGDDDYNSSTSSVTVTVTNTRTDFWLAFAENNGRPTSLDIFISSAEDTVGVVEIPGLQFFAPFTTSPGTVTRVNVPIEAEVEGSNVITDKGIFVTTYGKASVYGLNRVFLATDAFLGLPLDRIGTDYLVLAYRANSQFTIVGTQDNTTIDITPPAAAPYSINLDEGQVYQFRSSDVTGTAISSSLPVVVFGGNRCTFILAAACDHQVEQLFPTSTWGQHFVTMPLAGRLNGDTFRILAGTDNTTIDINGVLVATLNRGQFHEQLIDGPSEITANNPVLVAQFANGMLFDMVPYGDPFMMLIPPSEQFAGGYPAFITPDIDFPVNYVNVIAQNTAVGSIALDGTLIPTADFTPIGSSGFSGVQIAVDIGSHILDSPLPFAYFVYGFKRVESYGYPGGLIGSDVALVRNLTLTPATASQRTGREHCVVATVGDQDDNPLDRIRVDFTTAGVHSELGFALTDATGEAIFCYSGTSAGTDTITASVGLRSDTATVSWIGAPVAVDDEIMTPEDTAVTINVLDNDLAPNNPLIVIDVTQPFSGTAAINPDNTVAYSPALNFTGLVSFTYTVSDTVFTDTATVSVTITPVNDPPLAIDDEASTDEDTAVLIDVLSNDSDVDGDALTVSGVTQPLSGSSVISPNNTILYTPNFSFSGVDTFAYTVDDGNGGTATANVTVTVTPRLEADLTIMKDNGKMRVLPGETLTYTLTISNIGTLDATGVVVTDTLPAETSFITASDSGSHTDGSVTWPPFDLAAGASLTRTVTVQVDPVLPAGVETITNTVTVADDGTNGPDPTPENNTALDVDSVLALADLVIAKTAAPDPVGEAATLTYTITVNNHGPSTATGVIVTDTLPVQVTFGSATSSQGSCDGTAPVTCDLGSLTTAAQATVTIVVTPTATGTITNSVTVAGNQTDPDQTNNEAVARTVVVAANQPPVADDQAVTTTEDTPVDIVLTASDPDGDPLTFDVVLEPSHGALSGAAPSLNYTPNPEFCGQDSFTYQANDGNADSNIATVTIDVICVNDPPAVGVDQAVVTVDEGQTATNSGPVDDMDSPSVTLRASVGTVVDNGNGTWSWSLGTSDGPAESQSVTITADDGVDTAQVTFELTVDNVAPLATFANDGPVDEGSSFTLSLTNASDPSGPDTAFGFDYAFDCGDGAGFGSFGNGNSATCPTDDNGTRTVKGQIRDKDGGVTEYTDSVTVNNVAPSIDRITAPLDSVNIDDQPVNVTVEFSDPGPADTHDVSWDWGDGNTDLQLGVTSPAWQDHTYAEPGVYAVTVTVTDDDGGEANAVYDFIVIYDPDGGFVTGGGWIYSETGWCQLDPSCAGAEGKANFGLVARYKKRKSVPEGNTEFNFSAGGLNLHSDSYDWLVINQDHTNARYKGSGTINGDPAPTGDLFKFMIWVKDLDPDGDDTFRIKIWYEDGGEVVVYDNGFDQPIGGGNIKIHDK